MISHSPRLQEYEEPVKETGNEWSERKKARRFCARVIFVRFFFLAPSGRGYLYRQLLAKPGKIV